MTWEDVLKVCIESSMIEIVFGITYALREKTYVVPVVRSALPFTDVNLRWPTVHGLLRTRLLENWNPLYRRSTYR